MLKLMGAILLMAWVILALFTLTRTANPLMWLFFAIQVIGILVTIHILAKLPD